MDKKGYPGSVLGLVNDGVAGIPGTPRIRIIDSENTFEVCGSLDPGYPVPGRDRQAIFMLPKGTLCRGPRINAELEVKEVRHPIKWAYSQKLNDDGSLT
ncbi:hypothetical protein K8352_12990 [Flavobacteriaceae bacterium F89]|uniref:Uncharacterized protein n=1 Tax=Cerina litoralis TaxID=2874477 RepID=A0AAE3JP19_9FLAO|nr:hypothetical protein [Cerina litoralis]MCG2461670.1 hypothetical protein [Cerina litoralis]